MEKVIETVGELFEIVKSLIASQKARGEAVDKAIGERLAKAEQALYDARKTAFDRVTAELADKLTEDTQSKFDLEPFSTGTARASLDVRFHAHDGKPPKK